MGTPPAQGARVNLSSESGISLIEMIISATILVVVLLAVMATLDTASSSTAANRGRTVASALAEQDQERMRGMSAADLSNYHPTPQKIDVDGVKYTVESRSEWVRDSTGGAETCTANTKQADYMRITSTVTSNVVGRKIQPVSIRSLVAPRVGSFDANQGTLAVSIKDGAGAPQVGLPVTITGPDGLSDVTNALGCAVFGHVPIGTYQVKVNVPGYVDPSGATAINVNKGVTAQTVQTQVLQYAQAASVTANFLTKVGTVEQPTKGAAVIASNAALPSPGVRIFTAAAGGATSITAGGLFPFSDGYSFYSGSSGCAENHPTQYSGEADYFSRFGFAKPGAGQSAVVTVREPALNFQVLRGSGTTFTPYPSAHVVITAGCGTKYTTNPLKSTTDKLNASLQDPGFPFGIYSICADDNNRRVTVNNVANTKSDGLALAGDGSPALKLQINTSSSTSGKCT
jgi:Tfp pilus assembly protein PilV